MSGGSKLFTVRGGLAGMLHLRRYGRRTGIAHDGQFLGAGARADAAVSTVVAHAIIGAARHRIVVNVVHYRGIDVRHIAVIGERAVIPVRAIITPARVTETVVDATVETNVRTPVTGVPEIVIALVIPVRRSPEGIDPRCQNPGSGNPVIAAIGSVAPVAWRPVIAVAGTGRLAVFRERRRGLRGLDGLLVGGSVVGVVGGIILCVRG
jgi:hypothetical protein